MQTEARPNLGLPLIGEAPDDDAKPAEDDLRLWSVTSLISALDKPALVPWAAIKTAEAAVRDEMVWKSRLQNEGEASAVDYLKQARFRPPKGMRSPTELGSAVHSACESYALTGNRPYADAEVRPFLDQFDRFLQEFQPEYSATEICVFSPEFGYAGQADAFIIIDGQRYIIDYKTSRDSYDSQGKPKGPYPEVSLQLSAYRFSEMAAVWRARRYEQYRRRYYLLSEAERAMGVPVPEVDGGLVIYLTPDRYAVHAVKCDERVFEKFLFVVEAAQWVYQGSKGAVGPPMVPPYPIADDGDPFRGLP